MIVAVLAALLVVSCAETEVQQADEEQLRRAACQEEYVARIEEIDAVLALRLQPIENLDQYGYDQALIDVVVEAIADVANDYKVLAQFTLQRCLGTGYYRVRQD